MLLFFFGIWFKSRKKVNARENDRYRIDHKAQTIKKHSFSMNRELSLIFAEQPQHELGDLI